mmetsp:Transcript_6812/g.13096  ORF Transcript_6812/g.13096 Transcript_6812/m.13096 type:complete len:218 (+) Transcript_6812:93-746(+)
MSVSILFVMRSSLEAALPGLRRLLLGPHLLVVQRFHLLALHRVFLLLVSLSLVQPLKHRTLLLRGLLCGLVLLRDGDSHLAIRRHSGRNSQLGAGGGTCLECLSPRGGWCLHSPPQQLAQPAVLLLLLAKAVLRHTHLVLLGQLLGAVETLVATRPSGATKVVQHATKISQLVVMHQRLQHGNQVQQRVVFVLLGVMHICEGRHEDSVWAAQLGGSL